MEAYRYPEYFDIAFGVEDVGARSISSRRRSGDSRGAGAAGIRDRLRSAQLHNGNGAVIACGRLKPADARCGARQGRRARRSPPISSPPTCAISTQPGRSGRSRLCAARLDHVGSNRDFRHLDRVAEPLPPAGSTCSTASYGSSCAATTAAAGPAARWHHGADDLPRRAGSRPSFSSRRNSLPRLTRPFEFVGWFNDFDFDCAGHPERQTSRYAFAEAADARLP